MEVIRKITEGLSQLSSNDLLDIIAVLTIILAVFFIRYTISALADCHKQSHYSYKKTSAGNNEGLLCLFTLVVREPNEECRTFRQCLGYLISWMLVSIACFFVYLGKKFFGISRRIKTSELVAFDVVPFSSSVRVVIHDSKLSNAKVSDSARNEQC